MQHATSQGTKRHYWSLHRTNYICFVRKMGRTEDRIYYNTEAISFSWKYWQSIFYIIGSSSFLLGSILYFPDFYNWLDAQLWADLFFISGSSSFFCAEVREWRHHVNFACKQMPHPIDDEQKFVFTQRKRYNKYFFIYMLGNVLYLVGCIICIPSFHRYYLGIQLFMTGFGLLVCIEIHKLIMVCLDKKSIRAQIGADHSRAVMEISGAISQWSYFSGTLLFQWTDVTLLGIRLGVWGVILYVIGGTASCVYSIIYFKKLLELQRDCEGSQITLETSNRKDPSGQHLQSSKFQHETAESNQRLTQQMI